MGNGAVATVALTIGGCAAASAVAAAAQAIQSSAITPLQLTPAPAPAPGPGPIAAVRSRSTQHQRIAVLFRDDDVARGEPGPGLRVCWSIKSRALARRGQQGDGDIAGVARYFALQLYGNEAGEDVSRPGRITTSINTTLFTLEGVPVYKLAMLRSGVKLIVSRSGTPSIPRGSTGAAANASAVNEADQSAQRVHWTNETVTVWPSSAGAAAGDTPTELRIPQGQYLVRMLRILHPALVRNNSTASKSSKRDLSPFLSLLTAKRSAHGKELSESFAAVDGLKRLRTLPPCPITALKTAINVWKLPSTAIIVPGDGKTPFTAAAAAVSGPSTWLLHSIDPRMAFDSCSHNGKPGEGAMAKAVVGPKGQLECWRCLSEEWEVPQSVRDASCRVILAVHCHAPLGELWDRLPSPKYCISLPCCGDCGLLKHAPPIVSYRDPVRTCTFRSLAKARPSSWTHMYSCAGVGTRKR